MSDELDFTTTETRERSNLLAEAIEIIRYADFDLGTEATFESVDEQKSQAIEQLQKLNEEQALFAPRLDVRHLTQKDFEQIGIEPSPDLISKMKHNHFYYVGIPITLFPRSGWAFTRLECWLGFCLDEENIYQRPIIHEIFPDDVWGEILSFQDHLNLGLDDNLSFRAKVEEVEAQWKKLSGKAQAKLAFQAGAGAQLVIGPFSYRIRRATVRARGRGNVESFWRLDSSQYVDEEDIMLGVVLAVPIKRSLPINAVGELKAYHNFQTWSADVAKDWNQYFRYWLKYFGPALRAFFEGGMVLSNTMEWKDITRLGTIPVNENSHLYFRWDGGCRPG